MRLTPIPADKVELSQRALHDAFTERIHKNYGAFNAIREDGALLGPWAVWLQVPKTGEAISQLVQAVAAMPGINAKSSQAISLLTVAHFGASFEMRIHSVLGTDLGLTQDQIDRLTNGRVPEDLDMECSISLRLADALLKGGVVPDPLFRRARESLGLEGVNRVVFQVGLYCLVSMTVNAFDVPPPT